MGVDYEQAVETFEWDIPASYTVPSVVAEHASAFGDRVAVHFLSEDSDQVKLTYADLYADMNRFANGLGDLGVEKGDRVMHLFPRHPEVFPIQLGALATGALLVPCSSMLRPKDIAFRANDCAAESIVVHASLTDMVEPVIDETPLERVIVLDGSEDDLVDERWTTYEDVVEGQSEEYDGPELGSEDPMSINYTSGTTGQPKPVLHKHRWQYCFNRINGPYWWGIDETSDLEDELMWATTGTGWAKW